MFGIHSQESFQFSISEAICLLNGSEGRGVVQLFFKVTSQCLNLHAVRVDGAVLKEINLKPPISSHNWIENVTVKQLGFLFVCLFFHFKVFFKK